MFYYSVVNLLRIVIHYSKHSKSVQNVVIHYISSSDSLRVVNSLQIVNSLRVLFLVCRGPLGISQTFGSALRWSRGQQASAPADLRLLSPILDRPCLGGIMNRESGCAEGDETNLDLLFLAFLETARKTTNKKNISFAAEPLKSWGKKGKMLKIQKGKERKIREGDRESPKRRFRRKPQTFADFPRFTPSSGNSNIWRAQETAENRRFSQETEDFRRKPQETADWAPQIHSR